nr:diphthamide biosynthesis protein 1 [Ipomoea batatas]
MKETGDWESRGGNGNGGALEARGRGGADNARRSSSLSKALPRPKHFVKNEIRDFILNDASLNAAISLLPANYNFEIHKCVWHIRSMGAKCVALQFPEGLLMMVAAGMLVSNKLGEWEELNGMVPDLYDGEVGPDFSLQLGQENHAVYYLAYFQPSAFGNYARMQHSSAHREQQRASLDELVFPAFFAGGLKHTCYLAQLVSRDVLQPLTHSGSKPPTKDSLTNSWIATPVKSAMDVSGCTQNVLLRRLWLQ